MPDEAKSMRKAGDVISDLFREQFGPEFMETARSTVGLFSSWSRVVASVWRRDTAEGENEDIPAAAAHSRIRELERGMLLVEADHPGWIQILGTRQQELLSAVQRCYPELNIRGIAFRLSREPFSSI
jgi:predicted nucleic acid-binding Zn ribbon protein